MVPDPHVTNWLIRIVTTVVWLGDVRVPVSGVTVTRWFGSLLTVADQVTVPPVAFRRRVVPAGPGTTVSLLSAGVTCSFPVEAGVVVAVGVSVAVGVVVDAGGGLAVAGRRVGAGLADVTTAAGAAAALVGGCGDSCWAGALTTDEAGGVAAKLALGFVVLLWVIQALNVALDLQLQRFGVAPRELAGLPGILVAPLLHGGFGHLIANSLPLLVVGTTMLHLYPDSASKVT